MKGKISKYIQEILERPRRPLTEFEKSKINFLTYGCCCIDKDGKSVDPFNPILINNHLKRIELHDIELTNNFNKNPNTYGTMQYKKNGSLLMRSRGIKG